MGRILKIGLLLAVISAVLLGLWLAVSFTRYQYVFDPSLNDSYASPKDGVPAVMIRCDKLKSECVLVPVR